MIGTLVGNPPDEISRDSTVTLKERSESKAVKIGTPTEPVAPAIRMLWIAENIVMIGLGTQYNGCRAGEEPVGIWRSYDLSLWGSQLLFMLS